MIHVSLAAQPRSNRAHRHCGELEQHRSFSQAHYSGKAYTEPGSTFSEDVYASVCYSQSLAYFAYEYDRVCVSVCVPKSHVYTHKECTQIE